MTLSTSFSTKDVLHFENLLKDKRLNLEPAFQRKSVWSERDRKKLLQSMLQGFPVPSIFLYKREDERGRTTWDVLDGKQRLESLFYFIGAPRFGRAGFAVKWAAHDEDEREWTWQDLKRNKLAGRLESYQLQVVEVVGDLAEVIELFVRINSTGKALAGSEKRHAKYYSSRMLRTALQLATKYRDYFQNNGIVRASQMQRMKDVELVAEIMASIQKEGVINKKAAIDRALSAADEDGRVLRRVTREFVATMKAIKRIFPGLNETRFRNSSEFYSLALVVWRMIRENMVLIDRRRNERAMDLLVQLSDGVDRVRIAQRSLKGIKPGEELFGEYLTSVQRATDNSVERATRDRVLTGLLHSLFERKDEKRTFSIEQRRLLWHKDAAPKCGVCGCLLSWSNFEMDHRKAHSRGGKTNLRNAATLCKRCNAAKGNRPSTDKRRQRPR